MKILYLTQVLPYPLDAGPKVRIYYVLRYLAQYHEVTLVSFVRTQKDLENAEQLRTFLHAVHTVPIQRSRVRDGYFLLSSLVTGQPFLITRDHVASMHTTIKKLLAGDKFDFIHADQLYMAQYAAPYTQFKRVLDQHNAVWTILQRLWQNAYPGPRRIMMGQEMRNLRRYEARVCREFDHVFAVTEDDKRALQSLDAKEKLDITVMPICIDPEQVACIEKHWDAKNIICIGGMFYPPNIDGVLWFGEQVLPQIQRAKPDVEFLVVGARPAKSVVNMGVKNPSIRVTGYVDDTIPYLKNSAVFIVPLRAGGGMRVKILDAWARGIPIVSTRIGCEGIEVLPGENILLADSPADFADAVLRVIQDRALAQRLAHEGRRWIEQKYDWRQEYQKLDAVYPREPMDHQ